MKFIKRLLRFLISVLLLAALGAVAFFFYLQNTDWGFAREVSEQEESLRRSMVSTAENWIGTAEGSDAHASILEIYNTHEPLAQGYTVTSEDNWCATFSSAVAIQENLTDIIPTECGCERQIGLWQALERWEEDDNYIPLPGDYIYYAWDEGFDLGDCTGWADHVGIVAGTAGPFIKVIEGNRSDSVSYHIVLRGDYQIRGYGLPDFASKIP